MKIERTRIHFLSKGFAGVDVLALRRSKEVYLSLFAT